jgi:hypothetical protein
MKYSLERQAGLALIVFCLLLVCTIILHPSGGSIGHLLSISRLIIITHTIAIFSLPIGGVGFWGLSRKIGKDHFGSMLALAMMLLGLIAALLAGATNGLVLPIYLQYYKDAPPETIAGITPILQYGFSVNHAFDYIYTGAFAMAILCWSIAILMTKRLPVWLGWFGIALFLLTTVVFLSGTAVNSVHGLRIFVIGIVAWILLAGTALYKEKIKA